jgi:arginase
VIGTPEPALSIGWREELDAALPYLKEMQLRLDDVFAGGGVSIAATSRCAVSLATLPAVAKYRPSACIVWLDSHGDPNPPEASATGFLGGLAFAGPVGLWDSGLGAGLRLDQIVLVGQRDLDPYEVNLIAQHNIPHIKPEDDLANELRRAIGGLSLEDFQVCCEVIAEHDVVGVEIAEFQNALETDGPPVSPNALLDALRPLLERGHPETT